MENAKRKDVFTFLPILLKVAFSCKISSTFSVIKTTNGKKHLGAKVHIIERKRNSTRQEMKWKI